ncbi:MAG: lytic transglycosylase domain-containing protein [Blastocatellia bacterium]
MAYDKKSALKLLTKTVCLLACLCLPVFGDELHLKDGRVIQAEETWEANGIIWYRQGKITASVARNDVIRITKPVPGEVPKADPKVDKDAALAPKAKPSAEENRPGESIDTGKGATGNARATHKVTRILLKDGTQIDADSVWGESERIGYRLGKMETVIDRSEIARVVPNVNVTDGPPLPANVHLRFSTGNSGLDGIIVYNAARHGVDPLLIYLVMREESGFNYRAVSHVGARGLMQLMPGTAARLGVRNIHDPVENVEAGTRYLRGLIDMFGGDINLALAAYNAGEGAVLKYGRRIPPYAETLNYVWRINTAYRRAVGQ